MNREEKKKEGEKGGRDDGRGRGMEMKKQMKGKRIMENEAREEGNRKWEEELKGGDCYIAFISI